VVIHPSWQIYWVPACAGTTACNLPMLTQRRLTGELMDDPAVDRDELNRSLRFIRLVNRRFGGTAAAMLHLRRWAKTWQRNETIRIIDLGTGSADIPIAIAQWAKRNGHRVHITGIDLHEKTLDEARRCIGDRPNIELRQADALRLMDEFQPGSFDYAHAGMFLHHLEDIEVVTVLRIMDRLTTRGLIWNDLVRSGFTRTAVRIAVPPGIVPSIARHDARVSFDAAFTKAEAIDLAKRAGLSDVTYRRHLCYRFTLVSEQIHRRAR